MIAVLPVLQTAAERLAQAREGLSIPLGQRLIGLLGVAAMIGIAVLISYNRSKINWRLVFTGLGMHLDVPVLRLREVPAVEVHVVPSTLPPFGVGEMGVPAVAPAVANAIFAATGERLRRLPLRAGG